ncbi:Motile sperm domain-containing protein 2 [Halotydeus destructor]|nr:Motile sperm domain-containing protein 2 [Halotydeus destructor]
MLSVSRGSFCDSSLPMRQPGSDHSGQDTTLVDNVRSRVLAQVDQLADNLVDGRDVCRIQHDDHLLTVFIEDKMKELKTTTNTESICASTAQFLDSWMKWRKAFGINDLTPETLPSESWRSAIGQVYFGQDTSEDHVVYVCLRRYKKVTKAWTDVAVRFIVCCTEKVIARSLPGQGVRVVLDTSGFGLSNADISLALGIAPILFQYYPGLIRGFDVIDTNFMVRAAFQVIIKVFPVHHRDKIHFIDRKTLINQLGADAVPDYLGGTGIHVLTTDIFLSDKCPSVEEYGQANGFSLDSIKKFKKMLSESKAIK